MKDALKLLEGHGKYVVVQKVGNGAFSKVYLALKQGEIQSKLFAIKIVKDKLFHYSELAAGLYLEHDHVIQLKDWLHLGNYYYLIYNFYECGSMDSCTHKYLFNEEKACFLIRQLVNTLIYCQKEGIHHRDVKMENILIGKHDNIILCDFGLCHFTDPSRVHPAMKHLTKKSKNGKSLLKRLEYFTDKHNRTVGTPGYMSPEVVLHAVTLETMEASEVYAVGTILFVLLSDRFPTSMQVYDSLNEIYSIHQENEDAASSRQLLNDFSFQDEIMVLCRPRMELLTKSTSREAKDLLLKMLHPLPGNRITFAEMLNHPFFQKYPNGSV